MINAISFTVTFVIELSLVLGWSAWIGINREKEDIEGCPVCGDATIYAKFFFTSAVTIWFIINIPLKIVSSRNAINYYRTKYSNNGTNYSLSMSHVKNSEQVTLIVIE